jgi:hypothetical protein
MNDDTRQLIYGTILAFLVFIAVWLGFVYISACGFTLNCIQGAPLVVRTPIPTLIPVERSQVRPGMTAMAFDQCQVVATDMIAAWVSAGTPETEAFPFTDLSGQSCEGTLADIQPLFVENSLWFPGSLGCVSCHNADLTDRSGGLDLSSYQAMLLGSRRVAGSTSPGTDILGSGDWEGSLLHEVLVNQGLTAQGHSPDVEPPHPIIYAGQRVSETTAEVTATPIP